MGPRSRCDYVGHDFASASETVDRNAGIGTGKRPGECDISRDQNWPNIPWIDASGTTTRRRYGRLGWQWVWLGINRAALKIRGPNVPGRTGSSTGSCRACDCLESPLVLIPDPVCVRVRFALAVCIYLVSRVVVRGCGFGHITAKALTTTRCRCRRRAVRRQEGYVRDAGDAIGVLIRAKALKALAVNG